MLLQPLLLGVQLAAAFLFLAHAGLQLRHHQLQLLLAGRQPPPRLLGLSAQLCLCSQLLRQADALLFQLGKDRAGGRRSAGSAPGTALRGAPGPSCPVMCFAL